jgi:hypothetical protein
MPTLSSAVMIAPRSTVTPRGFMTASVAGDPEFALS